MLSKCRIAYFDGLCEPNPNGVACAGYVVLNGPHGGKHIGTGAGMTNNVAEYQAALLALRALYKTGYRGAVLLRGDSQLVVKQFNKQYACNAELLIPLLAQLHIAAGHFESLQLAWIPREENEAADEQSRLAYVEVTGRQPPVRGRKEPARATI